MCTPRHSRRSLPRLREPAAHGSFLESGSGPTWSWLRRSRPHRARSISTGGRQDHGRSRTAHRIGGPRSDRAGVRGHLTRHSPLPDPSGSEAVRAPRISSAAVWGDWIERSPFVGLERSGLIGRWCATPGNDRTMLGDRALDGCEFDGAASCVPLGAESAAECDESEADAVDHEVDDAVPPEVLVVEVGERSERFG